MALTDDFNPTVHIRTWIKVQKEQRGLCSRKAGDPHYLKRCRFYPIYFPVVFTTNWVFFYPRALFHQSGFQIATGFKLQQDSHLVRAVCDSQLIVEKNVSVGFFFGTGAKMRTASHGQTHYLLSKHTKSSAFQTQRFLQPFLTLHQVFCYGTALGLKQLVFCHI